MKLTGFRGYAWEADLYYGGIPNGGIPVGSIVPNIIYRASATAVFGPPTISEMRIPCEFTYRGALTFEKAWIALLKNLQPLAPSAAMLTGTLNDGTTVQTTAYLTIPEQADDEVNTLTVIFVAVTPFFSGQTASTGTQVFA